jgi:hypothetical protein
MEVADIAISKTMSALSARWLLRRASRLACCAIVDDRITDL